MEIKKEDLKKYNIICTNGKEARECIDMLEKLGLDISSVNYFAEYNCIVYCDDFLNKFSCGDAVFHSRKNINFYQFKKLYKKLIKEDFEVNDKGQIIKINNYESNKQVYHMILPAVKGHILSIMSFELGKTELDRLIELGFIFDSRENANKFIDYIKKYNKE